MLSTYILPYSFLLPFILYDKSIVISGLLEFNIINNMIKIKKRKQVHWDDYHLA